MPGTIPTKVILPYNTDSSQNTNAIFTNNNTKNYQDDINNLTDESSSNTNIRNNNHNPFNNINGLAFDQPPFPWAQSDPFIYVQQIALRSCVTPWSNDLTLTDAYRGPLNEIFKLLEIVRNHEDENR